MTFASSFEPKTKRTKGEARRAYWASLTPERRLLQGQMLAEGRRRARLAKMPPQICVDESEVAAKLQQGWTFVAVLPNTKQVILKRPEAKQ